MVSRHSMMLRGPEWSILSKAGTHYFLLWPNVYIRAHIKSVYFLQLRRGRRRETQVQERSDSTIIIHPLLADNLLTGRETSSACVTGSGSVRGWWGREEEEEEGVSGVRRGYANNSQCTLLHPAHFTSLSLSRLHGNSGLLLLAILVHLPVPWCVCVCSHFEGLPPWSKWWTFLWQVRKRI